MKRRRPYREFEPEPYRPNPPDGIPPEVWERMAGGQAERLNHEARQLGRAVPIIGPILRRRKSKRGTPSDGEDA